MSTLCLCDLSDNDLRVLASLSNRTSANSQPAPSRPAAQPSAPKAAPRTRAMPRWPLQPAFQPETQP